MNCPNCNIPLTIAERLKVEIDYCTQCRGVWLDRGELDKILERSETNGNFDESRRRRDDDSRDRDFDDDDYRRKKKRGGFLGELFDF